MSEEHDVLADIFKDTFDKLQSAYDAGKLPHARTSILPHILTMVENILIPLLDKSRKDDNYEGQLFAVSATFRWTIKRLMPIDTFMEHMQSERMLATDKVLDEMTAKVDGVTKEDVDERMKADPVLTATAPSKPHSLPGVA